MAAEIQHITYNEFLPTLLGQKLMDTFELTLKSNGYHMAYNDELPMTTLNSVANAILPLFLSLLPPAISFYDSVRGKRLGRPFFTKCINTTKCERPVL